MTTTIAITNAVAIEVVLVPCKRPDLVGFLLLEKVITVLISIATATWKKIWKHELTSQQQENILMTEKKGREFCES